MTIRIRFDKEKRWIMIGLAGAWALGVVGVILARSDMLAFEPYQAQLPGFFLLCAVLIYANYFAFWCPACGKNWGMLPLQSGPYLFSIDQRIRFCPFCGCDIDSEHDAIG